MNLIKIPLIFAFLLAMNITAQSQWYEWTDPFPITDSLSDNTNPFLHLSWENGEMVYMVWEHSADSTSTAIWMDNILDQEPPQIVLSEPGIHFSHPKILGYPWGSYGDILFYLLYQTDENGNEDIYAIPFGVDGTWGMPEAISATPEDDVQLSVSRESFYDASAALSGLVAWISGDDLYACLLLYEGNYYFDDPVLLDSGACSSPSVIGSYNILFNRSDSSLKHIYTASYNSTTGWNPPEVYYDSLECMNPTAASYYEHPAWSVKTDSNWQIMIDAWNDFEVYDISSPTPFDPAVLGVFIGVKSWYPDVYVAVEYPEDSVTEIFMTEGMGSGNFINFSNSGTMNQHPQFFMGESYPYNYYCWYDYLVWESFRNGHWQIWGAKYIQCGGSIEEKGKDDFIKVFPNPFSVETIIEFTLNSEDIVTAEIYDRIGQRIFTLAGQKFLPGTHQLRWDAGNMAPGVYFLRMKIDKQTYTSRLIII